MSRTRTLRPGHPPDDWIAEMAGRQGSPYTGKLSARPAGKPRIFASLQESLRRSLPHHRIPHQSRIILGAQYAFSKAWRNLSGPMGFNFKNQSQNQILGQDQTASRWSAPGPGKRTRREEHALSHRPQMSSGRLFLDRVGRHQSPSPLRRHAQTTTHFPRGYPETGTFYFAGNRNFLLCLDTMDRVEIISVTEKIVTTAGAFENCVHVVESSPIEKGLRDHKWYAPGVGQVKDTGMVLVKYRRGM